MAYNRKKKSLGGIIGTALGAGAGTLIGQPMLGAQLGGVVGSQFDNNNNKGPKEPPKKSIYFESQEGPLISGQFSTGSHGNKYMYGGPLEFKGPRHESGGIDFMGVEVEGGETMQPLRRGSIMADGGKVKRSDSKTPYIFSDRVNVPGTNSTFADYHKHMNRKGEPDISIEALAQLQENVTGRTSDPNHTSRTGRSKFKAKGGAIPMGSGNKKKYSYGGPLDINRPNRAGSGNLTMPDVPSTLNSRGVPAVTSSSAPAQAGNGFNFESILPYAGDIANVALGAFGGSRVDESAGMPGRVRTGRSAMRHARDMPTNVDVSDQVNMIRQSLRTLTTRPASTMNERLAAHSATMQGLSEVFGQRDRMETQLQSQRQQTLTQTALQLDSTDAQLEGRRQAMGAQSTMQAQQFNAQQDIARQQMVAQGVAGASRTHQMLKQQYDLQESEAMQLEIALSGYDEDTRNRVLERLEGATSGRRKEIINELLGR